MKAILSVLFGVLSCILGDAQVPKLSSYPAAQGVLFLDFDGQYVQGTSWNWDGPIAAQASGLSSAAITEIFNRVAEDFRIFNLNVTTDSTIYSAAPHYRRSRVIITPTYQWYGQAGGVAYVGTFVWGDDTPAWVFSGLLNNNVKYVAEAASHEAGHTLGLQHQSSYDINCTKTAEYSQGQGTGEISWSPIMGVGYYRNITTWHNGPNAFGCSNIQNDIEIIGGSSNNIGLRADDYGNNHMEASMITVSANSFQVSGLVNTRDDKDVFLLPVNSPTNFRLNAIPKNVGNSNAGANLDIRISLLNYAGDTLSRYNPSDLLNAAIDTTLNAATYYIVAEGVGNTNLADDGSLGFYTLAGTLAGTLPISQIQLTGNINKGKHQLNWNYKSEGTIKNIELEYSKDAVHFSSLYIATESSRSFQWQPIEIGSTWYRIKLVSESSERVYYSNNVVLRGINNKGVSLNSTMVNDEIVVTSGKEYNWQLVNLNGSILHRGRLQAGVNRVPVSNIPSGILMLRLSNNNENLSFKIIKQ